MHHSPVYEISIFNITGQMHSWVIDDLADFPHLYFSGLITDPEEHGELHQLWEDIP